MSTTLIVTRDEPFLRLFRTKERVLRLSDADVAILRRESENADAYAQYGYGRWLYFKNPNEGALKEAEELFYSAKDTVPDCLAAYSQMLRYGETSVTHPSYMDIEGSNQLLSQAIERGSTYAAMTDARKRIFGIYCDAEPAKVAEEIEHRIGSEIGCDPLWHTILSFAYDELDRKEDAIRLCEQAISLGDKDAIFFLAVIYLKHGNMALYDEHMEQGVKENCALCMSYQADMNEEDYEELDETEQAKFHQVIDERLHKGVELGDGICAYYLWYLHYYGELGFPKDMDKSFAYLEEGIRMAETICILQMVTEARTGSLPPEKKLSATEMAELVLKAARYSPYDKDALKELRRMDDPVFLLRHKDELEHYWKPMFEQLSQEEENEDDWEENWDENWEEETKTETKNTKATIDPRVIVIWPSGHMDLPKADVYKMKSYREMAKELIGAEGLDAVHYSPLLEQIVKEAQLDLSLVMYVDRDAQMKDLEDNAIGTLLYGTGLEVRGPIIICLEDPVHDCHSFKTLEDLIGTYTEINKHCGGLLIFKDDDDGRFDAWA